MYIYIGMLEGSEAPGKRIKRIKKVCGPIKEFLGINSLFNQKNYFK
jgi:hypothetical protein